MNDAPTITPPSSQTIDEDNTLSFVGGTQIALADIDVGSDDVTVTLGVTQGTLTMSTTDGLTFATGDGSEDADIVLFSSTLTAAQSALDTLVYTPTLNYNGTDTLSGAIADGGSTGSGGELSDSASIAIMISSVNDDNIAYKYRSKLLLLVKTHLPTILMTLYYQIQMQ